MSRSRSLGDRLYRGESGIDFVGRRRTWFIISGILILISLAALGFRGLNLGIEFQGGAVFSVPNATCSVVDAREVASEASGAEAIVTETGAGIVRVQTPPVEPVQSQEIARILADACGVPATDITVQVVGPTWGAEITSKAIQALIVFLVLVTIFLAIYFEWRFALAALIALAHDIILTVGIYAVTGLQVTPATLIGFLTILGYSLYDTVVVFDKVKEDTKGITAQSVMTYGEAANRAVNQVLVRSINTSITSLLPVLAIIVVGAGLLGAGTLLDLAVALAVGMLAGVYSSIFIATPVAVMLKMRQSDIKALDNRVAARRAGSGRRAADSQEAAAAAVGVVEGAAPGAGPAAGAGPERQQPKRQPRSKRGKK
jgi:preprotein translocase subunit SecF